MWKHTLLDMQWVFYQDVEDFFFLIKQGILNEYQTRHIKIK